MFIVISVMKKIKCCDVIDNEGYGGVVLDKELICELRFKTIRYQFCEGVDEESFRKREFKWKGFF